MVMALKPCRGCKREVDTTAKACPGCGRPHPTTGGRAKAVVAILGIGVFILCASSLRSFFEDVSDKTTAQRIEEISNGTSKPSVVGALAQPLMDDAYRAAVNDAIQQYNIVKSGGSAVDRCVHAGVVTAAMTQAKDQAGFNEWKAVQRKECGRAGMPGM